MSDSTTESEFHELLRAAYLGEIFEVQAIEGFLGADAFPASHAELTALHSLCTVVRDALAQHADAPHPDHLLADTDDYVSLISGLEISDHYAAIVAFGEAALYRLRRLKVLAPPSMQSVLTTLIEQKRLYTAVAKDGIAAHQRDDENWPRTRGHNLHANNAISRIAASPKRRAGAGPFASIWCGQARGVTPTRHVDDLQIRAAPAVTPAKPTMHPMKYGGFYR